MNLIDVRAQPAETPRWPLAQRIGFRFVFVYFVLYFIPFPLNVIPGLEFISKALDSLWQAVATWVAQHLLHLEHPLQFAETGSGDTTYAYVLLLTFAGLAMLATVVWSILDRRRRDYHTLHVWLRLYVRYDLIYFMLTYGLIKVIPNQFSSPSPGRLLQPYGQSSPMGLLWTFMGASTAYTIFAGAMETLGGVLLCFRRTITLGALATVAVMTNVVMLNFCYDVPVKLLSSHLVLMALFLLAPQLERLFRILVMGHSAEAAPPEGPRLRRRWMRVTALVLKLALLGKVVYDELDSGIERYAHGAGAPAPALYGIYEVDRFVRNGETVAPLVTDATRWRRATVSKRGYLTIIRMNDTMIGYKVDVDPTRHVITLAPRGPRASYTLDYVDLPDGGIEVTGQLENDLLTVVLRRDERAQLLTTRGFHWISETPFNR